MKSLQKTNQSISLTSQPKEAVTYLAQVNLLSHIKLDDQQLEQWTMAIISKYPFLTIQDLKEVMNSFFYNKRRYDYRNGIQNILDAIHEDIIQPRIKANEAHLQSVRATFLECHKHFSIEYILSFQPFPFPELTPKF